MNDNKFIDFDKLWNEVKPDPIQFKIFGVIEELPANLPAGTMLQMMRIERNGGMGNATTAEMLDIATSIFGEDRIDRWVKDHNLDSGQLIYALDAVMKMYNHSNTTESKGTRGVGKKK